MRVISLHELVNTDFNAVYLNSLQQFWKTSKNFTCIGKPKRQNLFLLLNGCNITYTDKKGNITTAVSGDIVYTPLGSEYQAALTDFQNENSHTIGINFLLFDQNGDTVILSEETVIFDKCEKSDILTLFGQTISDCSERSHIGSRITLFKIIECLAKETSIPNVSDIILPSLKYLSEHIEENPSITSLAKKCNISEVYFRKHFKKHTGTTPVKYRNRMRLEKAGTYLKYGDIPVQEISDMLGYSTVSHFIKEFKENYGLSPLKYRQMHKR